MKHALLLLTTVVLAGSAPPEDNPKKSPPKGPRISVVPDRFDFGQTVQNRTLQKEFSIRNYGTEDLVIESVSTSCGCTAALTEAGVVKAGGATPLRVSLETRNYSGRVERRVLVRSNDPTKGLLEIKVEATVVPEK